MFTSSIYTSDNLAQSGQQVAKNCKARDSKHDNEPASAEVLIQRMSKKQTVKSTSHIKSTRPSPTCPQPIITLIRHEILEKKI
ncbi:hypothetical protein VTL71DRAFT_11897 [Oculimacula yallundae]|uniref:Uncharacterized protein n=1 Tax=Oculimacula yallundae TaxID=86028 RepID=A0ABR4CRR5_9HELO